MSMMLSRGQATRRQREAAQAHQAAEAEAAALDHGTFRAALPLASTLEQVMERCVRMLGFLDTAAVHAENARLRRQNEALQRQLAVQHAPATTLQLALG